MEQVGVFVFSSRRRYMGGAGWPSHGAFFFRCVVLYRGAGNACIFFVSSRPRIGDGKKPGADVEKAMGVVSGLLGRA